MSDGYTATILANALKPAVYSGICPFCQRLAVTGIEGNCEHYRARQTKNGAEFLVFAIGSLPSNKREN